MKMPIAFALLNFLFKKDDINISIDAKLVKPTDAASSIDILINVINNSDFNIYISDPKYISNTFIRLYDKDGNILQRYYKIKIITKYRYSFVLIAGHEELHRKLVLSLNDLYDPATIKKAAYVRLVYNGYGYTSSNKKYQEISSSKDISLD